MMGKDCERIVSGLTAVIDSLCAGIEALAPACSYQLNTTGTHGEAEIPNPASGFVASAVGAMGSMSGDVGKMASLGSSLYTSASSFNNSYGSPWTEMNRLEHAIAALPPADSLTWRGDRTRLLCLMTVALNRAIDAKWAVVIYHDYLQRGYDNQYNGNEPSITLQETIDKEGIGIVPQDYGENVNMPPPITDPF